MTIAAESGQLQLNAFEPIIARSLHKSVRHLSQACLTLRVNCVDGILANGELLARRVAESVTLVTALNPLIGYEKAALVAKTALANRADDRRHRPGARRDDRRRGTGAAGAGEADSAEPAGGMNNEARDGMPRTRHRVVIVGGGAGGLELATRLGDRLGRRIDVTLIDRERVHVWKP